MKFRNLLSLSAVTLMSLGLTMGATGLSASAAPTGGSGGAPTTPTTPTKPAQTTQPTNGAVTVGPFTLDKAVSNNDNVKQWNVMNESINLGTFNLSFSNGTHSDQTYTVTPTIGDNKVDLIRDGKNYKNLDAKINNGITNGTSDIKSSYNKASSPVSITLNSNQDYGLKSGESDINYSTVVNWNLTSSAPTNTGNSSGNK